MTFFVSFRHQADGKGTRAKGKREEVLERWGEARLKRRTASKLMETKSVKNTGGSTAASSSDGRQEISEARRKWRGRPRLADFNQAGRWRGSRFRFWPNRRPNRGPPGNYTDQTRKLPDIASRFDNLFLRRIFREA